MICDYFIILKRENNCNISTKIKRNRHLSKMEGACCLCRILVSHIEILINAFPVCCNAVVFVAIG